ncbi:hypothetical protein B0T24DRAFT_610908 [Lasiosphaeria ovina]|uniref:Secreted protein n=1 Tax=Lasiosphaeria ovina TaxID=92902 RepID=A0AAE0NDJ3_9PEZI|nr:hypothetical protein B0T24DRAFT_610908 [Lasiosphaeria ovina]
MLSLLVPLSRSILSVRWPPVLARECGTEHSGESSCPQVATCRKRLLVWHLFLRERRDREQVRRKQYPGALTATNVPQSQSCQMLSVACVRACADAFSSKLQGRVQRDLVVDCFNLPALLLPAPNWANLLYART